jgi:hypothetical protein
LISGPFHQGLVVVFAFAAGLSVIAGLASVLRGRRAMEGPDAPPVLPAPEPEMSSTR